MIKVTCLGGTGSVTGSSYLIVSPQGKKILVDCGLFQGGKQMESRNWAEWGFDPGQIDVLFLTHAHIDHSGRIPKLVRDGYKGRIITSPPTAELCRIMLLDSAHIQEMDAEWQTRKNRRQSKGPVLPLYTTADAENALKSFSPVERDEIISIGPGVKARLRNAGHILGSSILELFISENDESIKIVFSGDLGKKDQLIVRDPHEVFDADYLFVESTYGDRVHRSFEDSKAELLEAINYSFSRNEKIMIPAFAVERTQEILYILAEFRRKNKLPDIPVYLDSPLAIKATEIFRKNKKYYDKEALAIVDQGLDPFDMPNLRFTSSTSESMAINEAAGSAIVIAGNGMCTAGRIKHHLKHNLWREGASIVIVGFQARGTTGREIVEGARQVKIFRENVSVRARVFTIGGFSAHADRDELLTWISHFESSPRVFVVHGEESAARSLSRLIRKNLGLAVSVPGWREQLILKGKKRAELKFEEEEKIIDLKTLMANAIIDIEKELKDIKRKISAEGEGESLKEKDLDRLKYIREELRSFRLRDNP